MGIFTKTEPEKTSDPKEIVMAVVRAMSKSEKLATFAAMAGELQVNEVADVIAAVSPVAARLIADRWAPLGHTAVSGVVIGAKTPSTTVNRRIWSKVLDKVDFSKKNGYAFDGPWFSVKSPPPKGSLIIVSGMDGTERKYYLLEYLDDASKATKVSGRTFKGCSLVASSDDDRLTTGALSHVDGLAIAPIFKALNARGIH